MKKLIKLIQNLGLQLHLENCTDNAIEELLNESKNLIDEDILFNYMSEFAKGKVIFNCGDGDYYYFIDNDEIMCFSPTSVFDDVTLQKIKENKQPSLINNITEFMYDIFFSEGAWVCEFIK